MRHIWSVVLIAAIGGCGNETQVTQPLRAQVQVDPAFHYQIATLSSPGPGLSQGGAINNQGWVAGFSGQPDGTRQAASDPRHAAAPAAAPTPAPAITETR